MGGGAEGHGKERRRGGSVEMTLLANCPLPRDSGSTHGSLDESFCPPAAAAAAAAHMDDSCVSSPLSSLAQSRLCN